MNVAPISAVIRMHWNSDVCKAGTRPDVVSAVGKLSQYCQDPAFRHRTALDWGRSQDCNVMFRKAGQSRCWSERSITSREDWPNRFIKILWTGWILWLVRKVSTASSKRKSSPLAGRGCFMASDLVLGDWSLQNIIERIYPYYEGLIVHSIPEPFFKGRSLSYRPIFDSSSIFLIWLYKWNVQILTYYCFCLLFSYNYNVV